ncbi:hypothetical protein Hanom_Chr04g00333981 [Helianthus anomalus]
MTMERDVMVYRKAITVDLDIDRIPDLNNFVGSIYVFWSSSFTMRGIGKEQCDWRHDVRIQKESTKGGRRFIG